MAQFGRFGKFPFRFGGDPSPQAKAFGALLSLEGVGLYPPDDPTGTQTIDGAWHQAMAAGLAVFDSVQEAAVFQAWPNLATDLIPEYERILNINPAIGQSDQSRRDAITPEWLGDIRSAYPDLQVSLMAIDERFSVYNPNHTQARQTTFGQLFSHQGVTGQFGGDRNESQFSNFSDDFFVRVLFDVGVGVGASGEIGRLKQLAQNLLNTALPAWCDFEVALDAGFVLDQSLLDEASL